MSNGTGLAVAATASRLLSSRILYQVLYAGAIILVANYAIDQPELLDTFDLAIAIISILMMISGMGLGMVVMRSGAQHSKDQLAGHYGTALVIETVVWVSLYITALVVYALFNGITPLFWLLAIFGVGHAAIQYKVLIRSLYRSLYAKEKIVYVEVIDAALKLGGIYWITQNIPDVERGIYYIAAWFSFTTILFVLIYGLNTLRYTKVEYRSSLVKPLLNEGSWFAIQAIVMTIYFEIDKLMLGLFQANDWADIPDGDIGRYSAAARLIVFLTVFHRIGSQVISPYLYASFEKNMDTFRKIVRISTKYQGTLGIGMGVGLLLLGPEIIQLLYKPELSAAGQALQLFGFFVIVRFIGVTSTQVFATTKQQPTRTKFIIAGVGFNILLDAILIPLYGFMGGVYATVITETGFQVLFYFMSRRSIHSPILKELSQLIPAFVAAGVMSIIVLLLREHMHVLLVILAGASSYGIALLLFGFIKKEDLQLLRKKSAA